MVPIDLPLRNKDNAVHPGRYTGFVDDVHFICLTTQRTHFSTEINDLTYGWSEISWAAREKTNVLIGWAYNLACVHQCKNQFFVGVWQVSMFTEPTLFDIYFYHL